MYGRWANNQRNGEGTVLHADGSIFKGTFCRDKKTGSGTVVSLDGSSYEGIDTAVGGAIPMNPFGTNAYRYFQARIYSSGPSTMPVCML